MSTHDFQIVTSDSRRTRPEERVSAIAQLTGGSLATVWREGGNPYLRFAEQPVGAAAAITGLNRSYMGQALAQAHFVEATKELLPTLQGVLDERLQSLGFVNFVQLIEGSWMTGNFIGKSLQVPRYQATAKFSCEGCRSQWQSSNATIELVLQKLVPKSQQGNESSAWQQHCDVIIRVYNQVCRNCGHPGSAQPQKKALAHVIERMTNDIVAFYIDAVPSESRRRPVISGERRDAKEPHDFMNCFACRQGACVRTWQIPDFEVERLWEIFGVQLEEGVIKVDRERHDHVKTLYEVASAESEGSATNSELPTQKNAIQQFLAIARRHIDWDQVEFKPYE